MAARLLERPMAANHSTYALLQKTFAANGLSNLSLGTRMIERSGRIIAIHAEGIDVLIQPEAACTACGARKACQGERAGQRISMPLQPGLSLGDSVAITMQSDALIRSALLAYLLPAICLILGAGLGQTIGMNDSTAMIGSGIGLAGGLLAARLLSILFKHGTPKPSLEACLQASNLQPRSTTP
jgi:positive regulator of sigma E activity